MAWAALHAESRPDDRARDLRRAVLVNVLSPHPWIFWATVGGPLLVEAGSAAAAAAFVAGFYVTLVGAKVAVAAIVEAGRRRGTGGLLPRALAARVGAAGAIERFGATAIVSAALLGAAAVALLADGISRL